MEQRLIDQLTGSLMPTCFQTKKEMAEKIGVPYRSLLSVCDGHGSGKTTEQVIDALLRYCIREHVPLDTIFPDDPI